MDTMSIMKIFILLSPSREKIIFLSFVEALTSLAIGQEMEEWTEHEDHRNMILMRRYRKDTDGSVIVIPLR
jgi:hypothetical protein